MQQLPLRNEVPEPLTWDLTTILLPIKIGNKRSIMSRHWAKA